MTVALVPPPDAPPEPSPDLSEGQPRATDAANADAFVQAKGRDYRYVIEWESWLSWRGTHWARDGAAIELFADVVRIARASYLAQKDVVRDLERERIEVAKRDGLGSPALAEANEKLQRATATLKWHAQSQNTSKVTTCIAQLRSPLAVSFKALDQCPWYLNVANGTADLRTGELHEHRREDLLTNCLDVPLDLEAKAPTWDRFLRACMADRTKLVLYLQRLVGYTLTASTQEQLLVFCYGTGSNGKSTFLKVLHDLLGPYGTSCPRTMLFAQKTGEVHPTELATLYGMRLGVCSEVGEGQLLDEAKVKDLTGSDVVTCRRMNEDFWKFVPTHKLWLAGNHKPVIKGTDNGIWRRVRLVPWEVNFDLSPDKDKDLPAKLLAERVGILAWAVKGAIEWQRVGICDPEEVLAATAEYREQSDPVADFFRAHLVFRPDGKMTCKALRGLYERWCEDLGHLPIGAQKLGARLRANGVRPSTQRNDEGKVVDAWAGVRQLADYERALSASAADTRSSSAT